eukprot:519223-Heterocapsa_arctica.AAC.1
MRAGDDREREQHAANSAGLMVLTDGGRPVRTKSSDPPADEQEGEGTRGTIVSCAAGCNARRRATTAAGSKPRTRSWQAGPDNTAVG